MSEQFYGATLQFRLTFPMGIGVNVFYNENNGEQDGKSTFLFRTIWRFTVLRLDFCKSLFVSRTGLLSICEIANSNENEYNPVIITRVINKIE